MEGEGNEPDDRSEHLMRIVKQAQKTQEDVEIPSYEDEENVVDRSFITSCDKKSDNGVEFPRVIGYSASRDSDSEEEIVLDDPSPLPEKRRRR